MFKREQPALTINIKCYDESVKLVLKYLKRLKNNFNKEGYYYNKNV